MGVRDSLWDISTSSLVILVALAFTRVTPASAGISVCPPGCHTPVLCQMHDHANNAMW